MSEYFTKQLLSPIVEDNGLRNCYYGENGFVRKVLIHQCDTYEEYFINDVRVKIIDEVLRCNTYYDFYTIAGCQTEYFRRVLRIIGSDKLKTIYRLNNTIVQEQTYLKFLKKHNLELLT